jgi:ribosomal protein S18 acetylase RimI-like enzyme
MLPADAASNIFGPSMTPPLSIRSAISSDIPAIVAVVNAAYAIETFLSGTRTDAEGVAEMMQTGEFLVAEDTSVGMAACVWTQVRGERGYLGMLAVEPSRQGTGLGRTMVEAAERHCCSCGCKYTDITVLSLRPELLPFYRKLRYREIGTEEFHPPPCRRVEVECHLIKMSKALS